MYRKKENKHNIIEERQKFKLNLRKKCILQKIMNGRYYKKNNISYTININQIKLNSYLNSLSFINEDEVSKNCKELISSSDINSQKFGLLMLRNFTINQNINFIETFLKEKLYENILICMNNNLFHNDIIYESLHILKYFLYYDVNINEILIQKSNIDIFKEILYKKERVLENEFKKFFINLLLNHYQLNNKLTDDLLYLINIIISNINNYQKVTCKDIKLITIILYFDIEFDENIIDQLINVILKSFLRKGKDEIKYLVLLTNIIDKFSYIPQLINSFTFYQYISEIINDNDINIFEELKFISLTFALSIENNIEISGYIEKLINYFSQFLNYSSINKKNTIFIKESIIAFSNIFIYINKLYFQKNLKLFIPIIIKICSYISELNYEISLEGLVFLEHLLQLSENHFVITLIEELKLSNIFTSLLKKYYDYNHFNSKELINELLKLISMTYIILGEKKDILSYSLEQNGFKEYLSTSQFLLSGTSVSFN